MSNLFYERCIHWRSNWPGSQNNSTASTTIQLCHINCELYHGHVCSWAWTSRWNRYPVLTDMIWFFLQVPLALEDDHNSNNIFWFSRIMPATLFPAGKMWKKLVQKSGIHIWRKTRSPLYFRISRKVFQATQDKSCERFLYSSIQRFGTKKLQEYYQNVITRKVAKNL